MSAAEAPWAELLRRPKWTAEALGQPLPDSAHAVSVALPRWADVVGYEEKRPEVIDRLASGYPRFMIHRAVRALAGQLGPPDLALPFPSRRSAERGAAFVRGQTGERAEVLTRGTLSGVRTTAEGAKALRAFWQHAGWIVSSRRAEAWLRGEAEDPAGEEIRRSLRRHLAEWYGCGAEDVFLTPTGMAALDMALQAVLERRPGCRTGQLGFPYVDTLKLQEKTGAGAQLIHDLNQVERELAALLEREPLAGCFAEIPGNPLLGSADLRRVTPVLRARGVPLVIDDVVATPFNVDVRGHADLVATSLTKFIVGTAEAMGGAVICNPASPFHLELRSKVAARHEELLWGADARVIESHARGFAERMRRHNANGLEIATRLRSHPAVERVWYPKWEFNEAYEAVRRPEGGWGALMAFLPRNAPRTAPDLYDRLRVCKGPSLGTVFTLACPFTLLAHYTELDWAETRGVPRHLLRLSVGLEDADELWGRLEEALGAAASNAG